MKKAIEYGVPQDYVTNMSFSITINPLTENCEIYGFIKNDCRSTFIDVSKTLSMPELNIVGKTTFNLDSYDNGFSIVDIKISSFYYSDKTEKIREFSIDYSMVKLLQTHLESMIFQKQLT